MAGKHNKHCKRLGLAIKHTGMANKNNKHCNQTYQALQANTTNIANARMESKQKNGDNTTNHSE